VFLVPDDDEQQTQLRLPGVRHHFRPGLHSGTLFGQHKFTACEIASWFGEEERNLNWKYMFAIQILMQAVVVPRAILKKQRSWAHLSGFVATVDEVCVFARVTGGDSHGMIPLVPNRRQFVIERSAQ